jgi:8-amino-7-oxononanoate synthase
VEASLAKGFGVPLAVLAGSLGLVSTFESRGACRVHCSAPSAAHLAAAAHALALNRHDGDQRRHRLALGIQRFRRRLHGAGLAVSGGFFPVQTPSLGPAAPSVHARLLAGGIRAVLHRPRQDRPARTSFLITATHQPWEIDRAVAALVQIAGTPNARNSMRLRDDGQAAELHA